MNSPYQQLSSYMPQYNSYQYNPLGNCQMYQQSLQQPLQQPLQQSQLQTTNQQMNVIGKIVDSVEMVKSMDIPMDGNLYYFPKADGTEIFGKQWLPNGQTRILTFKPILEADPNHLLSEDEKLKNEPFREFAEVFEKRFDNLEKQINDLMTKSMTKSMTKTPVSKTKKESEENE